MAESARRRLNPAPARPRTCLTPSEPLQMQGRPAAPRRIAALPRLWAFPENLTRESQARRFRPALSPRYPVSAGPAPDRAIPTGGRARTTLGGLRP